MFLKKIYFENWTSRGVNNGVTQFYTQFAHFSRQGLFWRMLGVVPEAIKN